MSVVLRRVAACLWWLCVVVVSPAQAHLMPAGHGTLNLVGEGAYLVLSVPATALGDVDRNRDGSLSVPELQAGWSLVAQRIQQSVQLLDADAVRPLEGLILTPTAESDLAGAPMTQLVVMGRFALAKAGPDASLRFRLLAYAPDAAAARVQLRVTQGAETSLLWLSPAAPVRRLFPSRAQVFAESLDLGLRHILGGYDHLLFLLVLLAGMPRWRPALLLLSSFTFGHAITLLAGGLGWVEVPAAVVEPAILCTIAVMASLELLLRWRRWQLAVAWRMAAVFACALVHGLGFSHAVRELGLQGERLWPTLLGFNLGIEAGQLLVVLPLLVLLFFVRSRARPLPRPAPGLSDA